MTTKPTPSPADVLVEALREIQRAVSAPSDQLSVVETSRIRAHVLNACSRALAEYARTAGMAYREAAAKVAPNAVFVDGVGWTGDGWEAAQNASLRVWVDSKDQSTCPVCAHPRAAIGEYNAPVKPGLCYDRVWKDIHAAAREPAGTPKGEP